MRTVLRTKVASNLKNAPLSKRSAGTVRRRKNLPTDSPLLVADGPPCNFFIRPCLGLGQILRREKDLRTVLS